MTRLDPPATPAEERAAEAMWAIWGLSIQTTVPGAAAATWVSEGDRLKEIWRTYARAALASAPAADGVADWGEPLLPPTADRIEAPRRIATELRRVANVFAEGFRMPPFLRDAADELDRLADERDAALAIAPPGDGGVEASAVLDDIVPLAISSTWDEAERRTIIRAIKAYGLAHQRQPILVSREQLARATFNGRYVWTVGKYADFWEQIAEAGRVRWRAGAEAAIDHLAALGLPVKAVE